ncbi:MAG: EcoAI/FtnUII family type I restriction enzme subunit R, partial [Prochlorococcaceae cyanobacterium]
MNEAETRAELIDPLLAAAGWGVVEGSRIRREFSITPGRLEGGGRRGKPLTADYVLTHRNTQLAVVEAKADNDFTGFAAFEDNALARIEPDALRRKGRVPTNASVFITIFQTFMSGP